MDKKIESKQQNIVNNHTKVISESLWSFSPELAEDYLLLASVTNHYKKLVVTSTPDVAFTRVSFLKSGLFMI